MTDDRIGTRLDHGVSSVVLNPHRWLRKFIHTTCPGHQPQSAKHAHIPDAREPPGHRGPVETPVIQRCDGKERNEHRKQDGEQSCIPAFGPSAERDAGNEEGGVGPPEIDKNEGVREEEDGNEAPSSHPAKRASREKQTQGAEERQTQQAADDRTTLEPWWLVSLTLPFAHRLPHQRLRPRAPGQNMPTLPCGCGTG